MKIARRPLFFGPIGQSQFGWYHAPADDSLLDVVVVICPPLGHEYVNSHRVVRHLADRFAAAGIPALRFDYHGTGDSSGGDEDPGRVGAWLTSVRQAMETARTISGRDRLALVGLRLGATLAAAVAADDDVDSFVAWAPCVRGRAFMREMKALHLTGGNRHESADAHIEPGGFVITAETQRDVGCLDVEAAPPRAHRTLIVDRDDMPADTRLADRWASAGIPTEHLRFPGYAQMFEAPHNTVVPHEAIDAIVGWIRVDASPRPATASAPKPVFPVRHSQTVDDDVVERLLERHDGGPAFGIVSEPTSGGYRTPTVLLPNAGSTHHVGPNRLYVLMARHLARAGFRCVRFDLPGLGDSVGGDEAAENDPYPPHATASVGRLIESLRAVRAHETYVIAGLCSGAHTAFHAALDLRAEPIVEAVLLNPLTFYYERGMPLDQSATNHYHEWQRYMRSMRSIRGWAKLFREDIHLADIGRTIGQRFRDILVKRVRSLRRVFASNERAAGAGDDLEADVTSIAQAGRRLTFIFSRFDPGYDLLMINARRAVKRLRKRGMLALWIVDDANHTFEASRSRAEMIESVERHLVARYRA